MRTRESVNSLILAELKTRDEYYSFSSAQGEMLDALLSDLGGGRDPLGVYRMLSDGVISVESLSEMVLDWLTGADTSNLVSKKDELDKQYNDGLMTISDYQKKMGELKEAATQAVGDSQLGGLFTGMFNVDDAVKARENAISSLGDSSIKIANMFEPGKYQWKSDAQKALAHLLDDFSTEDIEVMARLDINPEWDEVDLKNEIKLEKLRMKKYAKENFSFLDTGYKTDIEKFTKKISKLKTAMKSADSMTSEELLELMMEFKEAIYISTQPEHMYYKNRITFDEFLRMSDNVIKISACLDGSGLVSLLETDGVVISNGSACDTKSIRPSHVLKAIGLPDSKATSSFRVSFSGSETSEEIKHFANKFADCFNRLKKIEVLTNGKGV